MDSLTKSGVCTFTLLYVLFRQLTPFENTKTEWKESFITRIGPTHAFVDKPSYREIFKQNQFKEMV